MESKPKMHEVYKKIGKSTKIVSGSYKYIGKNFDIEFSLQECETKYWAVEEHSFIKKNHKMTEEEIDDAKYFYQYDRKSDILHNLKSVDYHVEQQQW